jgi:hypothetical protein
MNKGMLRETCRGHQLYQYAALYTLLIVRVRAAVSWTMQERNLLDEWLVKEDIFIAIGLGAIADRRKEAALQEVCLTVLQELVHQVQCWPH